VGLQTGQVDLRSGGGQCRPAPKGVAHNGETGRRIYACRQNFHGVVEGVADINWPSQGDIGPRDIIEVEDGVSDVAGSDNDESVGGQALHEEDRLILHAAVSMAEDDNVAGTVTGRVGVAEALADGQAVVAGDGSLSFLGWIPDLNG